jgi:hypothetical protein
MPIWAWVLIGIAAVVVVAIGVWPLTAQQRRRKLRERFGPEYDRAVESADSRREAEAELREREEHRARLQIRPLTPAARDRYSKSWREVQAEFVDQPAAAVQAADSLVQVVMVERGYPVEDFEQRAADISVDHPEVVENYRRGHELAQAATAGDASTEALRQAMKHYRTLFDELVTDTAGDTNDSASDRQEQPMTPPTPRSRAQRRRERTTRT